MSKTPKTDAVIAADTGDSGLIAELAKLSHSLEEKNADLREALEKAKEFVKSWGEIVDTQYHLWNECMEAINKVLK
jgi:signal transduction protein with GAF and PtsI domain